MSFTQLLLFGSALLAAANGACPNGWIAHGGSCYKFQTETENWVDARIMCIWHESDLIAIETPEEQAWFRKIALTFNHTQDDDGFWLGGTNWQVNGSWWWEPTKQAMTYQTWGAFQPNYRNNSELCLAAVHYFDYKWSDDPCNWNRLQYVCEKKEPSAPVIG